MPLSEPRAILQALSDGDITIDEAEMLLDSYYLQYQDDSGRYDYDYPDRYDYLDYEDYRDR